MTSSISPVSRPSDSSCDESLMQALARKQPGALEILHQRYQHIIRSALVRLMHNETEAEDTLQEVFLQIWTRAGTYDPSKGRPLGWLLTLARRRAIDKIRQNRAYENATLRLGEDATAALSNPSQTESDRDSHDAQELLSRLLESIPALQRQAIEGTFLKGMTQRELAQKTRIPLGTIKTRVELGLKKMTAAAGELENP